MNGSFAVVETLAIIGLVEEASHTSCADHASLRSCVRRRLPAGLRCRPTLSVSRTREASA